MYFPPAMEEKPTVYTLDRNDLEEALKVVNFCMKQMTAGHINPRELLMEMLQLFNSYDAEFFPANRNLTGIELHNTCSIKESTDDLEKYIEYYWQYDPLFPAQSTPEPINRVFKTDDVIPYSRLVELPYYRDYLKRINWFGELTIRLCSSNGFWGTISLSRSPNQPYFNSQDIQKAEFLLPYLIHAFESTMLFSRTSGECQALEAWLESRSEGIILLDGDVRPVFFNEKARQLCNPLSGHDSVHRHSPGIELPEVLIEDCRRLITPADGMQGYSSNRIVSVKNGMRYYINYSLIHRPQDEFSLPYILVHISPLSHAGDDEIPSPRDYGLSAREELIARYTGMGFTNKEIGRKLDISPFTVQSHLRNIFEKTGIKRRAQLANLVK